MLSSIKALAIGTILTVAATVPSYATILYPPSGDFGLLTIPGVHSKGFVGEAEHPSFSDLYTFSLDNTDQVSIKFGSSFASMNEIINDYTVSLYQGVTPPTGFLTSVTADIIPGTVKNTGGESGLLTTILGPGSYSFIVSGQTADNPAYSGTVSISLSTVPLPASAPMFGAALLALAGFGYGMNRWVAPRSKTAA